MIFFSFPCPTSSDFAHFFFLSVSPSLLPGNAAVLWCTCYTNVFKSVTGRFIKNLACSGIGAAVVCVPFDVVLGASPLCCQWLRMPFVCKAVKFLQRLFCSVTVLNFTAIALDRWVGLGGKLPELFAHSRRFAGCPSLCCSKKFGISLALRELMCCVTSGH